MNFIALYIYPSPLDLLYTCAYTAIGLPGLIFFQKWMAVVCMETTGQRTGKWPVKLTLPFLIV